jgi:hypothetical protein
MTSQTIEEIRKIAVEVALCASTWDNEVRLLGNATAGEIGRLCSYVDGLDGTLKSMEQTNTALIKKLTEQDKLLERFAGLHEEFQEFYSKKKDLFYRDNNRTDSHFIGDEGVLNLQWKISNALAQYQSYKAGRE